MHYLIYISTAVNALSDAELVSLLEQCRPNNLKLGITGMLLYKNGNFMQMLEGNQHTVDTLFQRIKTDPRHKDVSEVMVGETEKRYFPDWSMGFCNMDKVAALPPLDQYVKAKLTLRSFENDAQNAHHFMVMFNDANP